MEKTTLLLLANRGDTAQVTINGRSTANRAGVTRREGEGERGNSKDQ